LPETIRVKTPAVSSVPSTITGFGISANFETVMFYFDPVNDIDLDSYAYQLYDIPNPTSSTTPIASGKNKANVFTISVTNSSDGVTKTYYGRVAVVNSAGTVGTYTNLVSSGDTPLIGNQYISSLTAAKITAGTIGAHEITLGGATSIIKSSTYNFASPTTGWFIKGDGTASIGGPNGINFNGSTVAPAITLGTNVTILAGAAVPNSSGVAFSGLTISTAVGTVGGLQLGNDSNNQWLTSGYFRAGNGSKYILFDPAANSGAGSFTISSDVTIGGTVASTVVGNAATGASALQSGNGITKNGSNQITQISGSGVTITSNGNTSGQRVQLDSSGLRAYNNAGTNTVAINSDGSAVFSGEIQSTSGSIGGLLIDSSGLYKSVGGNTTRLNSSSSTLDLYGLYDDQYASAYLHPGRMNVFNYAGSTTITGNRIDTSEIFVTTVYSSDVGSHTMNIGGIAFPARINDGAVIPLSGQGPWRTNLQWTNGGSGRLYYQIDDNSTVKGYLTKTHLSDRRLKSNITQEVEDWLTKFNQIKIYEFEYNNLVPQAGGYECIPEQIKKIGVIADEIEQLFPEFVLGTATEEALIQSLEGKTQEEKEQLIEELDTPQTTVKIDGIYSKPEYQQVDYSSFVPLLMAVNLNQNKRIQELSAKVDELESRLV
jgi:hypothetical protein